METVLLYLLALRRFPAACCGELQSPADCRGVGDGGAGRLPADRPDAGRDDPDLRSRAGRGRPRQPSRVGPRAGGRGARGHHAPLPPPGGALVRRDAPTPPDSLIVTAPPPPSGPGAVARRVLESFAAGEYD